MIDLRVVEAEVVEADLAELCLRTKTGQAERRVVAGTDDDVDDGGDGGEQGVELGVDLRIRDDVVVVEHQNIGARRRPAFEECADDGAPVAMRVVSRQIECRRDLRPEHRRVVVGRSRERPTRHRRADGSASRSRPPSSRPRRAPRPRREQRRAPRPTSSRVVPERTWCRPTGGTPAVHVAVPAPPSGIETASSRSPPHPATAPPRG